MTENAIYAKGEALEQRNLSSEELDAVSGGWIMLPLIVAKTTTTTETTGQNDPAAMFQQIMQQMTGG